MLRRRKTGKMLELKKFDKFNKFKIYKNGINQRKHRKILFQTGVVIVALFSVMTLLVGNMITMSSFSTSLTNLAEIQLAYADEMNERITGYPAHAWLLHYWMDHANDLFDGNDMSYDADLVEDIPERFGKFRPEQLTEEEILSLTPEEQREIAKQCYAELQDHFHDYRIEQEETEDFDYNGTGLYLLSGTAVTDELTILFSSANKDGIIPLGDKIDMEYLYSASEYGQKALRADVWSWTFTLPYQDMTFVFSGPFMMLDDDMIVEFGCMTSADTVYSKMYFTSHIRNSVIVCLVLFFIVILVFLYWIVTRPLTEVKSCVTGYSESKNTQELTDRLAKIHSQNEIGDLADEFSVMATEMEHYTHEMEKLAEERERVATELDIAVNIQMQMLPQVFPKRDEFLIFASMNPAKEVGGDFYDCYMPDDDHLVMTIADVSGKGVPAALFMSVSKTMLKNRTLVGGKPSEILADVNNWLCEGNDNCMFVTIWHAILTISTGELICANAGHEYPGFRFGDKPFELVKTDHGTTLGLVEDLEYADEYYTLREGDALFVYTDGVPEATREDESMFGEERLESVLAGVGKDDTPEMIMAKVRSAVDEFAGEAPQYDDLTMLCLVMNRAKT